MQTKKDKTPTPVTNGFVSKINPKPDPLCYNESGETYKEEIVAYKAIERLAAIEHDQWCFWSQRMMPELDEMVTVISELDKALMALNPRHLQSPEHQLARKMFDKHTARNDRWESQWCIYSKLPEEVKEHDRLWAKKAYEAINK